MARHRLHCTQGLYGEQRATLKLTLPAAQEKIRKIKFNSLLVTTAYRASKSLGTMQVTSSDVYFAFNQNTNEHTMSDYLDAVIAVGLLNVGGKQHLMGIIDTERRVSASSVIGDSRV